MDRLFSTFGDLGDVRVGGGDSFCDRLNCRYTVYLLIIFALLVTTKHYVGDPISCWCPAHFTSSHVDFTNKVCWVTNTYYLPYDEYIPKEGEHNPKKVEITYYQWVGLILSCQAIMFYLPRAIWRLFNKKSGIAVSTITDAAIECQRKSDPESREKTLTYMVKHMGRFLRELNSRHMLSTHCKALWWRLYGNYLLILYLLVKLIYIGNVVGQIFLLNAFLGTKYHMYGFEVLDNLYHNRDISQSDRFPRVTMCNFKIRLPGNVQRYTVQCALPINLFNEIIFIFVWFWFVFVAVATIGSFLMWFLGSLILPTQVRYIKSRLQAMDRLGTAPSHLVKSFVDMYLRRDGLFLIRLVGKNASDIIAAELICGLWENYKEHQPALEALRQRSKEAMKHAGRRVVEAGEGMQLTKRLNIEASKQATIDEPDTGNPFMGAPPSIKGYTHDSSSA